VKHVPLSSVKHVALASEIGLMHCCVGIAAITVKKAPGASGAHTGSVGAAVGAVGLAVGAVGCTVGCEDGAVGVAVGAVGSCVGAAVGCTVGGRDPGQTEIESTEMSPRYEVPRVPTHLTKSVPGGSGNCTSVHADAEDECCCPMRVNVVLQTPTEQA
jgi:hypothetical protein